MASSIYKIPISYPGSVDSITVTNGGTNYSENPIISFTGGGGAGASAIAVVSAGVITSIIVTTTGQGYTSNPTVTITDPTGTGATATAVVTTPFAAISGGTSILTNNVTFEVREFAPGDSGLIRVWFCFETAADADTIISISHEPTFVDTEQLNSDQNFVIKSKGLYRFDIPASLGDQINIRSTVIINAIRLLRFDKIVIGA